MKKTGLSDELKEALLQQINEQEKIIEEQKNKINQLDTENFQLKNLIDNLPGDIYWKDRAGIWSGVNKRGAQSLQQIGFIRDRSDVIGKSDYQLFSKETADEYRKNDLEVMKLKTEMTHEEINQLPNGEKIIQLSTKRPLWDKEGNIVGVVGNTIDISYLKKIEAELNSAIAKAEAASQAKTEFLENMRHDIRTPLTGIVGFADLLKMESDNPHIKEYSENLVASSHALLNLLDEVLEAIRVGSGEIPKLKKKFCFEQTLNQVIELNRARALEKGLSLTLHMDKSIPKFVIGDKVRLHRVILELVANALNFTDTGFVTLSAELAKKDEGKLVLKLVVEDSGIGIPKDKQQEIYVQFKRLTPSYQGIYKGAGLGLSVVKQFIDELGGEIYVDSEVRRGTTFICLIPLQEPLLDDTTGIDDEMDQSVDRPLETTYAQEIKPSIEPKQSSAFRVLIVEDNQIAQTVAKSILAQLHCDADIADTGKKAVELWKHNQYQLILMDIGLPDMDGYEVTHQIRLQELIKKSHCPIIALTAHAGDENKKRCIDAGMNAVLTKPLTAKSCTDMLEAFIPEYHQYQSFKASSGPIEAPSKDESLFDLSSYPLLDIEEGIKTMGTPEVLAQMLQFMIDESLPSDIQLMKQAHDQTDWDKTQQLAHKIKGGAIYVGTTKIKMACQYLEKYWKSGQSELLEPLYQQIITVIDDSVQEINRWLKCH
ncbi:response regulator [Legionella shakespearei]|uniref:histidine kinase n=1 Tax=Legionella shakespearei DSM 23087 TaxID=1122169 RepID=A0A0W0Z313_9GAMM|nr:response regulator [Legionella shakespearei]KTD63506.1 sensory histidine-kinase / response regulator [Legionella shakespearei DSM 23087]